MGIQSLIQEQWSAGSWGGVPVASGSLWSPWAPEVQLEPSSATLSWQLCDGGEGVCSTLWLKLARRRQGPCEPITQPESPGEGLQLH